MRRLGGIMLAMGIALLGAQAADAATVDAVYDSERSYPADHYIVYKLTYRAAPGEQNRLFVKSPGSNEIRVQDNGAAITAGENCTTDAAVVICRAPGAGQLQAVYDLGDGDDTAEGVTGNVNAGPGDDTISGPFASVDGGPGADSIACAEGGSGAVTYASRDQGVSVSLDGVANDGAPGEGDNVSPCIRYATGGSGDDTLTAEGLAADVDFDGGPGDDHLHGGPRIDHLDGGEGNDIVVGDDYSDHMEGGAGDDAIEGQTGSDEIDGGDGDDRITGATGNDRVRAGAGNDVIDGGPDNDGIDAGAGNDSVDAGTGNDGIADGPGDDSVDAGPGDDHLGGGTGYDTSRGGDGFDVAHYSERTDNLTLTLDGIANDGAPGENDLIAADVEGAEGGRGDDTVIGNDADNQLGGGLRGTDLVEGRGGADYLNGHGDPYSPDAPVGPATLIGGPGGDYFAGVGSHDTAKARDGERDTVVCTTRKRATLEVDPMDVHPTCDPVTRIVLTPGGATLHAGAHPAIRIAVRCAADSPTACSGKLRVVTADDKPGVRTHAFGRAAIDLKPGQRRRVTFSLSRADRRALRRRGSMKLKGLLTTPGSPRPTATVWTLVPR